MAGYLNLSNLISQLTANQGMVSNNRVNGENATTVPVSEVKTVIEQIKNMLIGDIVTGEITDLKGNEASIRLGNGQSLNASLVFENNVAPFQKGEMVTFMVSDNTDNKVSLKPLDSNTQEVMVAGKALEAAGLAMNKDNLDMVKGLMDLNMPIDKNTLTDVAKLTAKFDSAPLDTILRLYKLDMPVTAENIEQFEAYKSYEHDMTGTMKNLSTDFQAMISDIMSNALDNANGIEASFNEAMQLTNDMMELLVGTDLAEESTQVPSDEFVKLEQSLQDTVKELIGEGTKETKTEANEFKTSVEHFVDKAMEQIKESKLPVKEQLKALGQLLNHSELPKEALSKIVSHKEFQSILSNAFSEKMFIKPEDVADKKEVKEFYQKLLDFAKDTQALLEKNGRTNTEFAKGMESVKNNLEFMNDLNHQMPYVQIPIKMQNGETKGDLYVYTNRKAKQGKDDVLTALLHLDMKNLGPLDVYVKLAGQSNVSTNFCLETEELLDFIYAHIDQLTKRLEDKGYSFNPTMTVRDKDGKQEETGKGSVDFVHGFLDVADPVIAVNQFMFDTKA